MCSLIYLWRISIYTVVKLCLCPINFQKTFWIFGHLFFCLLPIIYIIRKRCYLACFVLSGSNCIKRSNYCHTISSFLFSFYLSVLVHAISGTDVLYTTLFTMRKCPCSAHISAMIYQPMTKITALLWRNQLP